MSSPLPRPRPRDRVRVLPLQAERLEDGTLRISTPMARGWAGHARTTHDLARVLDTAFTEATIAGYAQAHGQVYDLDAMTTQVANDPLAGSPQRRQRGAVARRAAHPPEAWSMLDDGSWRSPAGRTYSADSKIVALVRARRAEKGLPVDTPNDPG